MPVALANEHELAAFLDELPTLIDQITAFEAQRVRDIEAFAARVPAVTDPTA